LEIRATRRTCANDDSKGGAPMPMLSLKAKGTGQVVGVPRQMATGRREPSSAKA